MHLIREFYLLISAPFLSSMLIINIKLQQRTIKNRLSFVLFNVLSSDSIAVYFCPQILIFWINTWAWPIFPLIFVFSQYPKIANDIHSFKLHIITNLDKTNLMIVLLPFHNTRYNFHCSKFYVTCYTFYPFSFCTLPFSSPKVD